MYRAVTHESRILSPSSRQADHKAQSLLHQDPGSSGAPMVFRLGSRSQASRWVHLKCTSSGPSSEFRRKGTCRMPEVAQVSDLDLDTADQKAREMGFPPFPRD